ncbi:MAG: XrtA/PEP-CTERM system histidine kinase PrsK [Pseudomonadales bacterium]
MSVFSLLSLGVGLVAYLALTVFCIVTWARKITGKAAFTASLLSLLFLLSLALTGLGPISVSFEVLALLAWMGLLMRVIGVGLGNARDPDLRPVVSVFAAALALGAFSIVIAWALPLAAIAGVAVSVSWLFASQLLLAIAGLVLLEQVARNTRDDYRWRLRYLNIGIGTLFTYELLHNAFGLLFNAYVPALVVTLPAVFALAAPFVAIASVRNPTNPLRLNLSRRFVFRSGVLIAAGSVLLLLGALGYLVRVMDGDWGGALLALLGTAIVVAIVTLSGSTTLRAGARKLMEEHLFAHKYDYREEWKRVTEQLTEPNPDFDLAQQVLRALGRVMKSLGGGIWRYTPQGLLAPVGQLHTTWNRPFSPETGDRLRALFESDDSAIDLQDPPAAVRRILATSSDFPAMPGMRFMVPLMTDSGVFGIAALAQPAVDVELSWEDQDLLKLIGRQSSGFLALREAERELAEADQLNSFSQISAFIVHDVKTISSLLSLLLQNAEKHKSNPAFIDDMLSTVGNAVQRMQKLLVQLRDGHEGAGEMLDLNSVLEATAAAYRGQQPAPVFTGASRPVAVLADRSKFASAVGHLLQNAIDAATSQSGRTQCEPRVELRLGSVGPWAEIVIEDTGPGMEQDFIDQVLFRPFSSTKGVAGMGVGAYQARSYIRSLGGDVSVDSEIGAGSRFIIRLPVKEFS